jgi:hypothetical protein
VDHYASPAPGVVTAGVLQLPANASLLLSFTYSHGDTNRRIGIIERHPGLPEDSVICQVVPSGNLKTTVYISCDQGQFEIGPITMTVL